MSASEPDAVSTVKLVDELRQLNQAIAEQRGQVEGDADPQADSRSLEQNELFERRRELEEALESGESGAAALEHALVGELELLRAALDDAAADVEPVAAVLCARLQTADRLNELQESVERESERANAERAEKLALELRPHAQAVVSEDEERVRALLARRAALSSLLARLCAQQRPHNERLQTLSQTLRSATQSTHELQVSSSDTARYTHHSAYGLLRKTK